jgi:hypothetical protein
MKKKVKKADTDELIMKYQQAVNKLRLMDINYTNPECFHLTDVVQSFNMYDSTTYRNAKEVKDFLDEQFTNNSMPLKAKTAIRYLSYKVGKSGDETPYWFVESK